MWQLSGGRQATGVVEQAARDAPYILDDQFGYLLRLASQRHLAIFHQRMRLDLTPTQFSAMIRLSETGGCSQNDLGRRAHMDVATIKGVVDRLLAKGLVDLRENPADRRQRVIVLSSTGAEVIEDLKRIGHQITVETLGPLSSEEQETIQTLLKRVV